MRVVLKGVHCQLTDGIKDHVQRHLVEPLERFFDSEAAMLEVHLVDNNGPKGGLDKECRATLFIPGARQLHIDEAAEDHYKAVDLLRDRLEKALKRELGKMRDPGRSPELQPNGQGSGLPS